MTTRLRTTIKILDFIVTCSENFDKIHVISKVFGHKCFRKLCNKSINRLEYLKQTGTHVHCNITSLAI